MCGQGNVRKTSASKKIQEAERKVLVGAIGGGRKTRDF
jgi:hypothetical protein